MIANLSIALSYGKAYSLSVDRVGELATSLGKSIATSAQKAFPKGSTGGTVVNSVIEVAGGGVAGA